MVIVKQEVMNGACDKYRTSYAVRRILNLFCHSAYGTSKSSMIITYILKGISKMKVFFIKEGISFLNEYLHPPYTSLSLQ